MVFRTFLNLSRGTRSSSTYIGRNAKKSIKEKFCGTNPNGNSNNNNNNNNNNTTAGSGSNGEYTHPFFNPSYQKPNELSLLDNVTNNSNSNTNNNSNNFTKPHPSSAAIQNYIIFDSYNHHNNTNNNNLDNNNNNLENKDDQVIFKMTNFKSNKNGQLNISIESITSNKTILNIRRLNSNSKKTLILNNNNQFNLNLLRTFSTNIKENTNDKELLENFEKLTINEDSKITDNQNKIELIEDDQLQLQSQQQQQNEFIDTINATTNIEEIIQQREQQEIAELANSLNLIKDSNEFTEQQIINTSSHLEKTPELIKSNTKDSIPSMDESLSNPDFELSENIESFLTQQEFLINNLLKINKHNELMKQLKIN
ncbi:hypothetical protein B5S32_g2129 [[Candida] boidinii]|nr:hypothetical protein B5S32_g2129 [[Candida] boidinii]